MTTRQWMYLVPRALAPSMQRIRRERRQDPRKSVLYRWVMGPKPLIISSLALLVSIAFIL